MSFLILAVIAVCSAQAQEVPTVDYPQLEEVLEAINDTQPVLINFWATWCAPCVAELPYFKMVNEEMTNLKMVFVSLDFPSQKASKLLPFIQENALPGRHFLLDDPAAHEWVSKVDERWSGALPATVFKNGSEQVFHEGKFSNYDELLNFLE